MVIKRIIRRSDRGHRSCLVCRRIIDKKLSDDEVYTCWHCGQQHFVDVYKNTIEITVVERPDVRHRPAGCTESITESQRQARVALIEKAEKRRLEDEKWIEDCRGWLEELAAMPEAELKKEYKCMSEETARRVKRYLEKRTKKELIH